MERILPSDFLRRVLLADAITSGAMGLLLALLAGPLSRWFGLPTDMLREVGLFLLGLGLIGSGYWFRKRRLA